MIQLQTSSDRSTVIRAFFQSLLLAAIMFAALGSYLLVLKWRGDAVMAITWTPLDDWFPFWPSWVWVYLIPYAVGPLLAGLLSRSTYWWYIRSGLVTITITLLIFVLFPTQTAPRSNNPDIGTGLTAELYKNMVEIDTPPANAAPSLHVSLTCLLLLALLRDFPRWWPVWVAFISAVWLSTLVTRQHHLIDVATGIALALLVARIASAGFFGTIRK